MDFNLLLIAASLFNTRNVSRAAEELGLSQSAVSHALGRLRVQFDDPMFVRTSKGMAPTDYAKQIQLQLVDVVQRAGLLLERKPAFDPSTVQGRIVIATTDYFEIVVMPRLQKILEKDAPNLQVSLRPTYGSLPKRELEEGGYDVAVAGFYRDLPEGFYQTKLFNDEFYCAVGKGHPLYKSSTLSRESYLEARRALITLQGDLREKGVPAKASDMKDVVYGTYSFTSAAWLIQESNLLLTAPKRLLESYQTYFPIKIWPSPIAKGSLDIRMIWHEQTHHDALRSWIRQKLKTICSGE